MFKETSYTKLIQPFQDKFFFSLCTLFQSCRFSHNNKFFSCCFYSIVYDDRGVLVDFLIQMEGKTLHLEADSDDGGNGDNGEDDGVEEPEPDTLKITNPTGSATWNNYGTYDIEWSSTGSIDEIKIGLYKGVQLLENIIDSTSNDGNYRWNIPSSKGYDGSNYRIWIWDSQNSGVYDYSAYFSIEFSSITITSPNGSEIWDENFSYKIKWETVGPINDVKIELFDGSEFIEYISNSTKNDGEFNWYISSFLLR